MTSLKKRGCSYAEQPQIEKLKLLLSWDEFISNQSRFSFATHHETD